MRFIFYDTETTGISSENDRIIELAAYDPDRGQEFCRFINPGRSIPAEATAIHHISDDMVRDAPSFAEIGTEFAAFCEGDVILVAHNNDAFDLQFMRAEYGRSGVAMPKWRFLDSLKWARRYRPDLPRHSLQFLREIYGIAANNAHRALDDVMMMYRIFCLMTDDLPASTVFSLMNRPRQMRTMPFGKHQGIALKQLPADYVKWLAGSGALDKEENQDLRVSLAAIGAI